MGRDKRLLPWGTDDKGHETSLLQTTVETLRRVADEVIVVANDRPKVVGARVVSDVISDAGSLGGILSGLEAASHDRVFVAAADMPFLRADLVRNLSARFNDHDAVVPIVKGRPEPLHALYGPAVAAAARRQIELGKLKIASALSGLDVMWVTESELQAIDPGLESFRNVNTPGEYERARHDARHSS
jgi:molybdopterin-guanine dinucleotide biosynthesis protein A